MVSHRKLKYVKSIDDLDYYLYRPSFGHWFFEEWKGYEEDTEKYSTRQKVRMFLEWVGGYQIYYAALGDELVGYVVTAPGGRRITCSSKKDIVLGPYYMVKEKRGSGLMSKILSAVLHDFNLSFESAYCYIRKNNIASIRAASKCGFEIIAQAEMRGMLRKLYLTEDEKSRFYIVKYTESMKW